MNLKKYNGFFYQRTISPIASSGEERQASLDKSERVSSRNYCTLALSQDLRSHPITCFQLQCPIILDSKTSRANYFTSTQVNLVSHFIIPRKAVWLNKIKII